MISEKKMKHILGVAKKMQSIALERFPENEMFAVEMFVLGWLHGIGHELDNSSTHVNLGRKVLMMDGYKYWEEVSNYGKPYTIYTSEALDILNEAELTTDENGNEVTYEERLEEIGMRRGFNSEAYRNAKIIAEKMREGKCAPGGGKYEDRTI